MTRDTGALIRELAKRVEPVRPLARPSARAAIWFGLSLPYLVLIVGLLSPAEGLGKLSDQRFVIEQVAALATGFIAAVAAFATTIPGYRRTRVWLPFLPLAIWMGDLGQVCLRDLSTSGSQGWSLAGHWACFPITILVGAFPAVAMAVMLRRGAPLTPRGTTALGALAVAGVGNVGVRFVHAFDASVIVLVWHVGAVFALSAALAWAGRALLNWRSLAVPAGIVCALVVLNARAARDPSAVEVTEAAGGSRCGSGGTLHARECSSYPGWK